MNADQAAPTPSHDSPVVLATDLDGTFLGGSDAERDALYSTLNANRDRVMLIFVTGRDIPFIRELTADGWVPSPDYVIGDVGTSVVRGETYEHVTALEAEIATRWGDAGARVRMLLADVDWLEPQPTPFRYRMSYYYDPARYDETVAARIRAAGFDCLVSANTYLDVLPRGVSKGPTLIRTIEHLGVAPERVLVAGDTMNDLSLFETGLHGVAVANSEPALLEHVRNLPKTTVAQGIGAAGILEVMRDLANLREAA
jgi:HAD superfamily hydrolase (TIGR01484 family)